MAKLETVLQLAPDLLVEREGWNVRLADDPDNIAHIEGLAESIYHVGVLEPLTAYHVPASQEHGTTECYVITNGHCRLAAVKIALARGAPIKSVPVRLEPKAAGEADHTFSMVARNTGKNLSQLELGFACKRLIAFGWVEADIAQKSGYSTQHIRNVLSLASAPTEVTKMVERGEVSASLATQAIAAEGNEGAKETLTQAVNIAKAEEAAKPKKPVKAGKEPVKPAPVKATLKHVAKAKGTTPQAATKAKVNKASYAPKDANALSIDDHVARIRELPAYPNALDIFDKLVKPRPQVWEALLRQSSPVNVGNGRDPDLTSLALIFGRAVSDAPDGDGIVTLVMSGDDWETACKLLRIKQPEPASVEERAAHTM